MNRLLKLLAPPAVLAIAITIAGAMWHSRDEAQPSADRPPPPVVRATTVRPTTRKLVVRSQGTVKPRTSIELVAQVAGEIIRVDAAWADGGFFEAGEVLVRIDERDYELAVARATADVARAELQVKLEEEEAAVARREWKALGANAKTPGAGKGAAPSPLVLRKPQLREARASAEAARAALEQAKLDLERTKVRSPFRGRVLDRRVDVGQFVNRGTVLGRIYSVDSAEVRLPVRDRDLAFLDLPLAFEGRSAGDGPAVRLTARFAGKNCTWEGRIVRTEGEVDPRSRMVHVVARVPNPYDGAPPLAAGMFVRAAIQGRQAENVIDLPRHAILRRETTSLGSGPSSPDANWVLVIDAKSRLRYRAVGVLRWQEGRALVESGLAAGEQVCLSALDVVVDGMPVRVDVEESASRG